MWILARLPWWLSVCLATLVFTLLRFVVPNIEFENPLFKGFALAARQMAWFAGFFLLPAVVSALLSYGKSQRLERQSGIESIRSLGWKEFEELLGEAYRRDGYSVVENDHAGPDGGVDLLLKKSGNTYVVQCKQWRDAKVGVSIVREMFGVMHHQNATGVIIVTSGMFTQEARNFANGKPIDLVEGSQLAEFIRNVQSERTTFDCSPPPKASAEMICPVCGAELIVRTARRGSRAGNRFLGCTSYPKCQHTQDCLG